MNEGEIVAGRYRVDRVLGVGGMGVVVAATDERLGAQVAIKFLLSHALGHPEIVARFAREARAAVRIKSEHVARVMDVGTLPSGVPYMVMEYLQGRDLASELEAQGRLSMDDAIDYVLQASEALVEAHQLGVVHRDLKPANLFLVDARGAPLVKVLDFGISKMDSLGGMTGSGAAVTQTASLLGSPLYMSPEQMDSARSVDLRTDVWALGVILYELLTGNPPFIGESIPQLCIAIMSRSPPPLRAVRPDIPPRLEAVILRCLEKNRELRFASVDELAVALAEFAPPRSRLSLERINARSAQPNLVDSCSGESGPTHAATSPAQAGSVHPARSSAAAPPVPAERVNGSTQATWGRTAAERGAPYVRWAAVAVPTLIALGLGAALLSRSSGAPVTAHTSTAPITSVTATSQTTASEPTSAVTPAPPAVASAQPASPTTAPATVTPATASMPVSAAPTPPPSHFAQRGHGAKGKPSAPTPVAAPATPPLPVTSPVPAPAPANNAPPAKPRPTDGWEDER
ncbi:MAG TPA: protein kinase [Polyangiaceae bacterium]|nr:protein kinase [Polyangiaceae bacterium]